MKLVSLENLSKYNELLSQKTVRSVNSVKPDSNGNVQLGTEKSTFNKVVYDTGYFSIGTNATYNFDLTGSDLENVSKENINIRLVAKVTTAHNGFEVGDIAQLSTGLDYISGKNLGVCAYIRNNTLYVYSGNDTAISIYNTNFMVKANVQIKAVLTAFIPDDGSILLIAEDQTNTSKLIGLPDGTLTWKDKNIVRSVNGVNADENGNVKIEVPSADIDTSEFVKSVNGSTPDSTGNISIDIPSTDGMVKSVNSQIPDSNGNVDITIPEVDLSGVVKSVNSITPDSAGNVTLGSEKSTFNKVVYDTGYFSITTSKTYNFDLTGSDLENVSKENVNIRLVAKVVTAHNGFEVGDIAQLSPGLGLSPDWKELDVCSYMRGNTLYFLSGSNVSLSIRNETNWLEKAKVQIKAVLTAFIPDDGSILLIAEDQTNTSKLIGLPDGTLTWRDKNISLLSPVHYSRSSNFETSGQTSIKLPSYLSLMVNGHYFRNDVEVTVDISDTSNWDSTETDYTVAENRAGKDFYIYAVDDKVTKSVHIVLSANSTVPTGYTDSSSRKIGGFHCLCADVGTPTWRNPATLKDEAHWLSGYVKGDILPYSVWDLLHRAESSNEGMVFSPETHMWYDIYLASWDGSKLVSVYGGTTADGTSVKKFHGEMFAECAGQINKELISRDEFIVVAKGSNERTAIHGAADAGTTGGHVDTNNRRMISNIGLEDCCGFLWQYCKQSGSANGSKGWNNNSTYNSSVDGNATYGSSYGNYYRAVVGGTWASSSYCGSRCVGVHCVSVCVDVSCGGRLSSRERVVTGL